MIFYTFDIEIQSKCERIFLRKVTNPRVIFLHMYLQKVAQLEIKKKTFFTKCSILKSQETLLKNI